MKIFKSNQQLIAKKKQKHLHTWVRHPRTSSRGGKGSGKRDETAATQTEGSFQLLAHVWDFLEALERQQAQTHPVQEPFLKRGEAEDLRLKDREGGKKETQKNLFFCYTHAIFRVELHQGVVVFQRWWSRTGRWGRWKHRDHWSIHTYYHYAPPPPQSQPATACGGNHGNSSGHHGLINGGKIYQRGGVRVLGLVLDTHSIGEDVVYRGLFSLRTQNFFALCLKRDVMWLECSHRFILQICWSNYRVLFVKGHFNSSSLVSVTPTGRSFYHFHWLSIFLSSALA